MSVHPRKLDTGLVDELDRPVAFRTYVRNRVIALLSRRFNENTGANDAAGIGILKAHGGFVDIVKLPGPLPTYDGDEATRQLWSQLLGRAPAISVACGDRDLQPAGIGGYKNMSFLDVHLYFTSNHPRSAMARVEADVRATGDGEDLEPDLTADPGIDVTMEIAEQLLTGQRLDTERWVIKHLQLKRETVALVSNTHVIGEQRYLVGVTRSIDHTRGLVKLLAGINTVVHPPEDPTSPAAIVFETEVAGET
jgi:hypothetical protein